MPKGMLPTENSLVMFSTAQEEGVEPATFLHVIDDAKLERIRLRFRDEDMVQKVSRKECPTLLDLYNTMRDTGPGYLVDTLQGRLRTALRTRMTDKTDLYYSPFEMRSRLTHTKMSRGTLPSGTSSINFSTVHEKEVEPATFLNILDGAEQTRILFRDGAVVRLLSNKKGQTLDDLYAAISDRAALEILQGRLMHAERTTIPEDTSGQASRGE